MKKLTVFVVLDTQLESCKPYTAEVVKEDTVTGKTETVESHDALYPEEACDLLMKYSSTVEEGISRWCALMDEERIVITH